MGHSSLNTTEIYIRRYGLEREDIPTGIEAYRSSKVFK